jgi:hypothetical protein
MRQSQTETLKLPINLRKWLIRKFVEQKEKEQQHIESERRKLKRK